MEETPDAAGSAARVASLQARIEDALTTLVPEQEPPDLYEPVRYVLDGGGKRLRPLLVLLAAEAYGVPPDRAMPAALAVEVFHNFTLVHDDIMDHAATRRGRPTVHVRWDESTAILCGDYLLALAYDLLASTESPRLGPIVRRFHRMVAHLCEGQTLDKAFETRPEVTVVDYLHMIDRKTAALLEVSLELGGLLGGAGPEALEALQAMGRHMGRAFQIQDDLLDLVADDARWGKTIGGDLIEGKKTYLLLRTLERATGAERDWFARIVQEGGLPAGDVPEARARMEALGILDEARREVHRYTAAAIDTLQTLPDGPPRHALRWLLDRMQRRAH